MARLVSPTGVTVVVDDDTAAQLRSIGYADEKAEKKAPAKKSAPSKSEK